MEDFCLIQGDCTTNISQITGQVDMIFADPPYFLSVNIYDNTPNIG